MRDRKKGGRGGRKQGKEFMDAAPRRLQAPPGAAQMAPGDGRPSVPSASRRSRPSARQGGFRVSAPTGTFGERWWDEQVTSRVHAETPLLQRVEAAVSGALDEEVAARRQRGDAPLEDSMSYRMFVDQALDRLLEEESGSLEEM